MPYQSRALADGRRDPDLIAKAELAALQLLCDGAPPGDVIARTGLCPGHVRFLTGLCQAEQARGGDVRPPALRPDGPAPATVAPERRRSSRSRPAAASPRGGAAPAAR